MTTDSAQRKNGLPRGERDDLKARPWSEWLPRVTRARGESERRRRGLRSTLERVQAELGKSIEQSVGDCWVLPGQLSHGLEVTLLAPDQERHDLTLFHPVIRIGTDASCQIRLHAPEVSRHHCEIRVDGQALFCLTLDDSARVEVNGQHVPAGTPAAIGTGDTLEVGPFVLTIGMQRIRKVDDARVSLELTQPLHFPARDPIQVLGENSPWVRVACGSWSGYLKVPESWLRSAYEQLGWPRRGPSRFAGEDEVDRSLTAFVLHRIAQSFAQRSGLEVNLSGVVDGTVMCQQIPLDIEWAGVRFALRLGDRTYESECVWPWTASHPPSTLLDDLSFSVSIVGGWVSLNETEIRSLSQGDILLPDVWLPDSTLPEDSNEPRRVALLLQGWQRPALLSDATIEISKSAWRLPDSGGTMTDEELDHEETNEAVTLEAGREEIEDSAETVTGEPVDLERELEVIVAFELDRISVPLEEISRWDEGATVQLDRSPNDHVKILLRQGKGARLLGYGRAIVVDDKLGIQIQRWLGQTRS